jgi:hypothetical protein
MFILAFRFRRQCAEKFPYDAYPVEAPWTGPTKAPKLVRKWRPDRRGCLTCTWRQVDPNSSI